MASLTRRSNPVADMLNWLEGEPPLAVRGFGLSPYIRIEDFVENGVYVLRAEMPGIDPDKDVELSVEGDVLTIKGERQEEEKEKGRHEFHYGSFSRSLTLPRGTKVEDIKASYTDGVLELKVPLEGAETTARKIPVQRAEG
jgi:HSP20 family molecular chaperone IbpA